ncbi:MAG: hypothetical protein ACOYMP_13260 [Nodosilinea sp.]
MLYPYLWRCLWLAGAIALPMVFLSLDGSLPPSRTWLTCEPSPSPSPTPNPHSPQAPPG